MKGIKRMPELVPPQPLNATRSSIEEFAAKFSKTLEFDPLARGSLRRAVQELSGNIVYNSLDFEAEEASLLVRKPKDFDICLSSLCGQDRNRFSIAHELGHYLLHYLCHGRKDEMRAARSGENTRIEWEANWFAGALLMPSDSFKVAHTRYRGDVELLAAHFGVSKVAAEVRKKVLYPAEA